MTFGHGPRQRPSLRRGRGLGRDLTFSSVTCIGALCRHARIAPAGGVGGLPPTVIAHGCAAVALAVGPAKGAGQSWAATQSADPLYLAHESKNCRSAFSQVNSGPNKAALEAAHQ